MRHIKIAVFLLCSTGAMLVSGCGGGAASAMIAGTVTGLSENTSVDLLNNGTDEISVKANGSFVFGGQFTAGSTYNVTVATNPAGEACTVENGSGKVGQISEDVSNILVTCVPIKTK
ncbi:MAG: hypothetical protein ACHP7O_13015 [Burkholderiales bacterium]